MTEPPREEFAVLASPGPGEWVQDAACATLGDEFLPDRKPEPDDLAVAARVCRHCLVRQQCAGYAAQWATYGVWAGRWYDTTRRHAKAV